MQLGPISVSATPAVLASQTIDMRGVALPGGGVSMRSTDRALQLAGSPAGIDVYTSLTDAIAAARVLSDGEMPGLAVVRFRGGFRLHDVHTVSRTYDSVSTHAQVPPRTTLIASSSVPFAAGNIRTDALSSPAVVRDAALAALVDGARTFVPDTSATWAGYSRLVER